MKKITGLLAILLVVIITITACGGKKSESKKTSSSSKSKVSKTVSKTSQSSETTGSEITSSASESTSTPEHLHGEAEESQWSQQSSEAAKVMTVAEARQTLRELNINDGNFSNADINKYILEAQAAGQEFGAYMVAQGFGALN
ncbi:MAG: hypothetical protein ACTIDA_06775 [Pseudolactococcus laudensis]